MPLETLEARGFRNLAPVVWTLGGGRHLVVGENGAGKTSLLEAIYLLATTRSFRTHQLADCCRHGEAAFQLRGRVDGTLRSELSFTWSRDEGPERRVDEKRTSLADHLAALPVLAWTRDDAGVLTGPPADRRRLLDRGVIGAHPRSLSAVVRYRRTLRAKRDLLLRGGSATELATWNDLLASAAAELVALRSRYVVDLEAALRVVLERGAFGIPRVDLRYRPSPACALEGPSAIRAALDEAVAEERRSRRVLTGPHRDDLAIRWDGKPLRRVASAGERKALGLALLAAQAEVLTERRREPLVLLDDADTELDRRRLAVAWGGFATATDMVATSNRPEVWGGLALDRRWRCAGGEAVDEGAG